MLDYRDATVERLGVRLVVAHVQDYIDDGRLRERPDGTRNPLQTVPLLDAIEAGKFDAVFGGGRRDEEKARAKERVFSLRDSFGAWDPRRQRPELWDLYNGKHAPGEHVRVFPLSNWTELDVWRYIEREGIALPDLYYAHEREVFARDGMWLSPGEWGGPKADRGVESGVVRYRTVGDMSCTGAVDSDATDVAGVILELARHRGSPSAARPAPTTGCPRPPWRTARSRGTSDDRRPVPRDAAVTLATADDAAPAHRHDLLRLATAGSRRRRQVDPGRPAALRHQVGARRPARRRRAGQP